MESEAAKHALGCLLAREVLPFDAPGIKRLLSNEAGEVLLDLCVLYSSSAQGIPSSNWLGTNFVTRSLYFKIKRWVVFYILLKTRLLIFFKNIQIK